MCCFGVKCFCRLGVPLSKSNNLAKNKTKKTRVNSSSPFCWFAWPFQLLRLGCFAIIIIIIIIIFFSPFSSPPPLSSYRGVMRLRSAGVLYGVWGHAPASVVSAASWRCECIRVCLICGITAEGLRGGKEGQLEGRGGRYKRADIVLATSSPPFPRRPRF